MCSTCGCGTDEVRISGSTAEETVAHTHVEGPSDLHHESETGARGTHTVELEQAVLAKNDHLAQHSRAWLSDHGLPMLNMMSSPGSGKTTLLERTIASGGRKISVIEGDQETVFDAERIRAAGARAVQVNTGSGCHLDAQMVRRALDELQPEPESIVFVENVGNLVCPALFDLGESARVVIVSVTEGDDKPLKYPHMFNAADLVLLNKTDLLPHVDFDVERFTRDALRLNPAVEVLAISAKTGENFDAWLGWVDHHVALHQGGSRVSREDLR